MSVRYMEGYESIRMSRDLTARGAGAATAATQAQVSNGPARYSGGRSLVRAVQGPQVMTQRSLAPVGNSGGISLSFSGKLTSFNSTSFNRTPVRYLGGKYVGVSYGGNPAGFALTDNFRNWPNPQNITALSSSLLDVMFDTTRNEYVASIYPNITSNQFLVSPTLTSTAWTAASAAMSGGTSTNLSGWLHQDETTGTLICISGNRIFRRLAGASTVWEVAYTHGSAALASPAIYEAGKWIAPINGANQILTSSDGGSTWVLSATIANTSGASIASKPGTIVIGRSGGGAQPFAVSTNGGASFTTPNVPNPPAGASMYVAYGNGVFVGVPGAATDPYCYVSADGLTWKSYPFDRGSAGAFTVSFANGYFFLAQSGPINSYSPDGINWEFNENGVVTAYTSSLIGLQGPSQFYSGFGISSDYTLYYRYPVNKNSVNALSLGIMQRDTWANYEVTITKNSATSYNVQGAINGIPFDSRSFTWDLMSDTGPRSFAMAGNGYGAYNGSVAVMPVQIAPGGVMWTADKGETTTFVTIPGMGAVTFNNVIWTGTRFMAFTTNGTYASPTGMTNWARVSAGPSGSFQDVEVHGNTIIAVGHAVGAYWRSADGGETWTQVTNQFNSGYIYSGIAYLNGVWIAQPAWTSSGQRDGKWSSDDGLTWQTIPMNPGYTNGHATGNDRVLFASNAGSGGIVVTVPVAGQAPVFTATSSGLPVGIYTMAWTGKYFLASMNRSITMYYSVDGLSWTNFNTSANTLSTSVLSVDGAVLRFGGDSPSYCTIIYPEFTDMPLAWSANAYAFSAIDDVVITDFLQPNAGPQGEVQIRLMPSDTDIQAEWNKVPEDAVNNAAAATVVPISRSNDTYVEANDVGLKDKYGTSAFTYPAGLRPVAIQVEGFYERVFTNTPKVKLGLQALTTEVQTPEISISSVLGQSTYVSKVVETNPDNNGGWTRETINATKLTNEKTG